MRGLSRISRSTRRRGVVAAMVAILMAVLLSFVALTVDIGQLHVTRAELQRAVAAVEEAMSGYVRDRRQTESPGTGEFDGFSIRF